MTGEKAPDLSSSTLVSLQGPARAVRETAAQLKQAQTEWETAKLQLDELTTQLETALVERGEENLSKAVETAGETVGLLRRREQLEERVGQLEKQWKNLQRDHQELLEDQVLKPSTLRWLGVPFVVGITMLAGGVYWSRAEYLGWPVALLGAASLLVAVLAKIGMERAAAVELEHCDDQLQVLREQLTEARAELSRSRGTTAASRRRARSAARLGRERTGWARGTPALGSQRTGGQAACHGRAATRRTGRDGGAGIAHAVAPVFTPT